MWGNTCLSITVSRPRLGSEAVVHSAALDSRSPQRDQTTSGQKKIIEASKFFDPIMYTSALEQM